MKKRWSLHLLVATCIAATIPVAAQTAPNYYRVEYIKTKPGKTAEYQEFLHKNVTVISAAAIKAGRQLGWGVARVVVPTGTEEDHDMIGFYAYERFEQLEPLDSPPDQLTAAIKSLGFPSMKEYAAKRDPMRDIKHTEWWRRVAGTSVTADNRPQPGEYVTVTFLKVQSGKTPAYNDLWKKYSLPIQEERAKQGRLKSYSMWQVMGSTDDSPYNHVSLARYANFKAMDNNDADGGPSIAEKVHAGKDWRQMRRDMQALRTSHRSEMIKLVESVR